MCPLLCRFAVLFATMMVMHPARLRRSSKQRSQGYVRELNMASRFELRQPTDGENLAQPCLKLQVRYWEQVSNRIQVLLGRNCLKHIRSNGCMFCSVLFVIVSLH